MGAINESDVLLASASNAIIIGFNVRPERNASALAEQEKVDIRLHTIIYEPHRRDQARHDRPAGAGVQGSLQGPAEVREVFRISKVGNVAGCMVQRRLASRATAKCACCATTWWCTPARSNRCKRFKNDASEVKNGLECGITLENFADVKPGDVIEAFATERVAVESMA